MKANKLYTVLFCFLFLTAMSCVKEEPVIMDEDGLVRVPVGLNLTVEALIDGTPETKSIIEPEVVNALSDDAQIKNIVVLQFNGVTSTARLVGGQTYFDHWPLTGDEQLTLVASDTPNTVVVLANTFDRISITSNTTFGDFLKQDYTTISGLSGVLTTSGGNEYFRLSGSQYLSDVSGVTNVTIALKRNVAKIVINVTNASENATPPITISQVQLREINAKHYYLAHIASELTAEDATVTFQDTYSSVYPHRFDDALESFPAANNPEGANEGDPVTYTYYVPANLRGTTSNTQQYSKSLGAPDGATRFCIYATYGDDTPINYTYYLGGNLTNDFNIQPNYKYIYNITINSKGNPNYDYRIEDMGEVKFQTDANCYMLHPPTGTGQSRIYAIPIRRAAVFWNEYGHTSGVGVYGAGRLTVNGASIDTYETNQLVSDSRWYAEVLWSDFQMTDEEVEDFLIEDNGYGFDPKNPEHSQPYFRVKVKNGMKGNVVIGVKKWGNSQNVLWSWHLWITDYNPDKYVVPESGKYVYGVDNGEIHRYNNATWDPNPAPPANPGIYASGFMMDRNLGALAKRLSESGSSGMHYQYGRKDPFLDRNQNNVSNSFYLGGTTSASVVLAARMIDKNSTGVPESRNVRYSVLNPMTYIYVYASATNWTVTNDDLADGGRENRDNLWNDPIFLDHTGDQDILESRKSIYDPCPPGWKVPISGTWGGFQYKVGDEDTYTAEWEAGDAMCYYPEGHAERDVTGSILFPASGFRYYYYGGSTVANIGLVGYCWTATLNVDNNDYAQSFGFSSSGVGTNASACRINGYPVRCVRE